MQDKRSQRLGVTIVDLDQLRPGAILEDNLQSIQLVCRHWGLLRLGVEYRILFVFFRHLEFSTSLLSHVSV